MFDINDLISMLMESGTEILLIFAVGGIVVFFLIRELVAWYYKINAIVRSQNEQSRILSDILEELKRTRSSR